MGVSPSRSCASLSAGEKVSGRKAGPRAPPKGWGRYRKGGPPVKYQRRRRGWPALVLLLAVLVACATPSQPPAPGRGHTDLLLVEVYPNGLDPDGADQFIRIYNPLDISVDLTGWSLGDTKVRATFPPATRIEPGQSLYIARTAAGFRRAMGAGPDFVWTPRRSTADPPSLHGGATFQLGRDRGVAILRDEAGRPVDALVYGGLPGASPLGWKGGPVPAPSPGEIIDRARDEASWTADRAGGYLLDTDRAADWMQGSAWFDLRVYRPGQTWFEYPTYQAERVVAYAAPESSYVVLTELLARAEERIDLNVYDFTLLPIARQLAAAARRGVQVRLLMEAGSMARLSNQERYVARLVREAGGEVRWMVNDPGRGVHGRYVFNHAKYGVIDGKSVFVQSENMVRHGVPQDPSFGNRGWGVIVEDRGLAAYLSRVFASDWVPAYGDSVEYKPGTPLGPPPDGFEPEDGVLRGDYPHPFPPLSVRGPVQVTPVLAPDHALLESKGVIGLMRQARESLYIEQQYVHLHWGDVDGAPELTPNIYLTEAIAAARRGVRVRILLSDAYLDPENAKDNTRTVAYVNALARQSGLDMEARIVRSDVTLFEKIHNKGIIVDERKVLVSSINWSRNSPTNNREVSLLIDHPEVGRYFSDLFIYDWYDGTPAPYPLITEVDAAAGFVEVTYYGQRPRDIGGWSLRTPAGTVVLPSRTILAPGRALVITSDSEGLRQRFGRISQVVELPGLRLGGVRGEVRLIRSSRVVDALAWGMERPWKLADPGSAPLCRPNPGKDTNTSLDWSSGHKSSPGLPGCGK